MIICSLYCHCWNILCQLTVKTTICDNDDDDDDDYDDDDHELFFWNG